LADYWWEPHVQVPLRDPQNHIYVDVQKLIFDALNHSLKLKAAQEPILIRADDIVRAEAEFDATAFVESKFVDISEPVGNTLVTGGPPRLNTHDWSFEAGIRKKTSSGARITASQRMGHSNSNSVFFTPQDQGTTQLSLGITQPLLNGAGHTYNTSMIVLAELNTQIADDQFRRNLQNHLLEVATVYWQLYMERAMMLQRQRHLERAVEILSVLENRIALDSLQSQIIRARSAVASRKAELERAQFTIRNIESRLRTLVNSPELVRSRMPELVTRELPLRTYLAVNLDAAIQTALTHRPEMDEALQRVKAASVRLGVSKNEWLPALSLVLETYVSGLEGNSNVGGALQRQLDTGAPSYTAGLVFETPILNRAASARVRQRKRELRQMTLEFEHTTQLLVEEVEVAVRDATAAFREMGSKETAMLATQHEADHLRNRWELLPGTDRSASLVLEDILNAQERLMEEETSLVKAQVDYVKALTELKRVTGTMVCINQSLPLQRSNVIEQP
jgi:outer membrane protein TolC